MHFELITTLPEAVRGYLQAGVLGRGAAEGHYSVGITPLYDFGFGKHKKVDDYPYGGGEGMVLRPEPAVAALEASRGAGRSLSVLLSPAGRRFDQALARRWSRDLDRIVLLCGRYEGIDDRVLEHVDEELSLGDFVLTGGELAALVVVDAVARLLPGVLGNDASPADESFEGPLLEYPQFTRPRSFRGQDVPPVLLSGNHAAVDRWRREQAVRRTLRRRPDLLADRSSLPPAVLEVLQGLDEQDSGE